MKSLNVLIRSDTTERQLRQLHKGIMQLPRVIGVFDTDFAQRLVNAIESYEPIKAARKKKAK